MSKTYTVEKFQHRTGLLRHTKTVTLFQVLEDGVSVAVTKNEKEAAEYMQRLQRDEAEYQRMISESGKEEWQFLDENSAG